MQRRPFRVVELVGDATARGSEHGERLSGEIKRYLADRLGLSADSIWAGQDVSAGTVLELADSTLGHHRVYAPDLYEEMEAMARAAGITDGEAVVVGGFTDIVDVVRSYAGAAPTEDNCTAVIDPGAGVLAQTWDMHFSAEEFVVMLDIQPDSGPAAYVQTTAGCLGQIGMNEAGIAIGINNLTSMGRPGVTWPFVVRKVLQQTDFDSAVQSVLDADLAGGHNFLLLGPDGVGADIEAMPGSVHVDQVTDIPFVHTNHCIDPTTSLEEGRRTKDHIIGSALRLERGRLHARDLDKFFADPAIAKAGTDPHVTATCGAVVMHSADRRMESVWGLPGESAWEAFAF